MHVCTFILLIWDLFPSSRCPYANNMHKALLALGRRWQHYRNLQLSYSTQFCSAFSYDGASPRWWKYWLGGGEVREERTAKCISWNSSGLSRKAFSSLLEPVFQPAMLQVKVSLTFLLFTMQPEASKKGGWEFLNMMPAPWVRVAQYCTSKGPNLSSGWNYTFSERAKLLYSVLLFFLVVSTSLKTDYSPYYTYLAHFWQFFFRFSILFFG